MWSATHHIQGTQTLTIDQYDYLVRSLEYVRVKGPCGSTKEAVDNTMIGVLDNWHFFQLIIFTIFYLFRSSASYFLGTLSQV